MRIIPTKRIDNLGTVRWKIIEAFAETRFTFDIDLVSPGYRDQLSVCRVRLQEKKPYCGNHPNECPVFFGVNEKHKTLNLLEGADWVEFNDRLNDVLDQLEFDGRVQSGVCIIRLGQERRIEYDSYPLGNGAYEWVKKGEPLHYANYIGKIAPASYYPDGTPGLYLREGQDAR